MAATQAQKDEWAAHPPFPCAKDHDVFRIAITAACLASSPKAVALVYATHGVPVFPCNPAPPEVDKERTKTPLVSGGYIEASVDRAVVEDWFARCPDALVGGPTGAKTGFFVVDVDSPENHAHDGIAAWRALEAAHGAVRTLTFRTANGGMHFVFAYNPEQERGRSVGCSKGCLPPGIEVKGDGGYIILPGSKLTNGRQWDVEVDMRPAAAPKWLLDLILGEKPIENPRLAAARSPRRTRPARRRRRSKP
jgi:hypothetical protein